MSKSLLDEFTALHGSTICRELINLDLVTDEDIMRAFEAGAFKKCQQYVEDVALLVDKML